MRKALYCYILCLCMTLVVSSIPHFNRLFAGNHSLHLNGTGHRPRASIGSVTLADDAKKVQETRPHRIDPVPVTTSSDWSDAKYKKRKLANPSIPTDSLPLLDSHRAFRQASSSSLHDHRIVTANRTQPSPSASASDHPVLPPGRRQRAHNASNQADSSAGGFNSRSFRSGALATRVPSGYAHRLGHVPGSAISANQTASRDNTLPPIPTDTNTTTWRVPSQLTGVGAQASRSDKIGQISGNGSMTVFPFGSIHMGPQFTVTLDANASRPLIVEQVVAIVRARQASLSRSGAIVGFLAVDMVNNIMCTSGSGAAQTQGLDQTEHPEITSDRRPGFGRTAGAGRVVNSKSLRRSEDTRYALSTYQDASGVSVYNYMNYDCQIRGYATIDLRIMPDLRAYGGKDQPYLNLRVPIKAD